MADSDEDTGGQQGGQAGGEQLSGPQQLIGDLSPKLVSLTEDVLFGDVWERPGLSPRDRSLVTIASLVTGGNPDQLRSHVRIGLDNGLTPEEIGEVVTHLAFYAGWPKALTAVAVAREVLGI